MLVKCINNRLDSVKDIYQRAESQSEIFYERILDNPDQLLPIIVKKEYVVYAMALNAGDIWYFIADENFTHYPVWKPASLFQILDNRLSKYWVFSHEKGIHFIRAQTFWAFPEWAEDPDFYTKLTSSYEREIEIFLEYKKLMDEEFLGIRRPRIM